MNKVKAKNYYHLSVKYFSRKKGQAAVSAAAYRRGEKLYDHYYGKVYDFTMKTGIVFKRVLLPLNAPSRLSDSAA